jgi:hypothetical protein
MIDLRKIRKGYYVAMRIKNPKGREVVYVSEDSESDSGLWVYTIGDGLDDAIEMFHFIKPIDV